MYERCSIKLAAIHSKNKNMNGAPNPPFGDHDPSRQSVKIRLISEELGLNPHMVEDTFAVTSQRSGQSSPESQRALEDLQIYRAALESVRGDERAFFFTPHGERVDIHSAKQHIGQPIFFADVRGTTYFVDDNGKAQDEPTIKLFMRRGRADTTNSEIRQTVASAESNERPGAIFIPQHISQTIVFGRRRPDGRYTQP